MVRSTCPRSLLFPNGTPASARCDAAGLRVCGKTSSVATLVLSSSCKPASVGLLAQRSKPTSSAVQVCPPCGSLHHQNGPASAPATQIVSEAGDASWFGITRGRHWTPNQPSQAGAAVVGVTSDLGAAALVFAADGELLQPSARRRTALKIVPVINLLFNVPPIQLVENSSSQSFGNTLDCREGLAFAILVNMNGAVISLGGHPGIEHHLRKRRSTRTHALLLGSENHASPRRIVTFAPRHSAGMGQDERRRKGHGIKRKGMDQ